MAIRAWCIFQELRQVLGYLKCIYSKETTLAVACSDVWEAVGGALVVSRGSAGAKRPCREIRPEVSRGDMVAPA